MGMSTPDSKSSAAPPVREPPPTAPLIDATGATQAARPRADRRATRDRNPRAMVTGKRTVAVSISRSLCRADPYHRICRCTRCPGTPCATSILNRFTGAGLSAGPRAAGVLADGGGGWGGGARACAAVALPAVHEAHLRRAHRGVLLPPRSLASVTWCGTPAADLSARSPSAARGRSNRGRLASRS